MRYRNPNTFTFVISFHPGITGTVVINEYGDRKPDYTMAILNNRTWVTMFQYTAANGTIVPVELDGLVWPAGSKKVPFGSPPCGWDKELCPEKNSK